MRKPNKNLLPLIAGAVLLILTACAPATPEIPVTGDETPAPDEGLVLAGTEWRLISYGQAESETPVLEDTDVTLNFEDNARLSGSTGCNTFQADYNITMDFEISITDLAVTEIACEGEGVMEQERQYLDALGSAGLFEYTPDTLKIWYENGQNVLNFTRVNG